MMPILMMMPTLLQAGRPANVISSNSGYNFLSILLSPFSYMWSWIRYLFYPATPPSPPQAKPSTPSAPQPNQSSTIYPESSASSNKLVISGCFAVNDSYNDIGNVNAKVFIYILAIKSLTCSISGKCFKTNK